ncbi:MAG: ECF transporter S component [Candidatus Lokiarchaeota archaeon]|nr:ECF transporter S component [Candidatus Lokiarchaeota archaeon]MBD3341808.1 ECF transporter S component [Candidatus Lokiarchaeota archaeon]
MAHIHLPDGSFSILWVTIYFILAILLILSIIVWMKIKGKELTTEQKAMAGILAAVVFIFTQIPIPAPWGGTHLNFTPLLGILAGPFIAVLVNIVVNIFSALIGHGAWSLLGANTIIYSAESISAWYIYKTLRKRKNEEEKIRRFTAALVATGMALIIGTLLLTVMVGIAGVQGVHEPGLELMTHLWLLNTINLIVGAVEAIITGYIIEYIGKVRPNYISSEEVGK